MSDPRPTLPTPGADDQVRWLRVRNANAAACPGGGLLRVTGTDSDGTLAADKPSADGQSRCLVASAYGVAAGGSGWATWDSPATVRYAGGTPAAGETWGAKAGEWEAYKDKAGFAVLAAPDTDAGVVLLVRDGGTGGGPAGDPVCFEFVTSIGTPVCNEDGTISVPHETRWFKGVGAVTEYEPGGCPDGE